jgi:peptidoglycan/LPS O-acetylase OafA/YrhL
MTATALDEQSSETSRSRPFAHLPGLDGVRAIAVAAVLLFHADPAWLPGGFLGVDIFFTLSGFLITSLLLAELGGTGGVRLGRFYQRRARRLLPALFLVLVATSLLALTVAQDAAARVREDATAALLYVTNWWYVLHGQSYFEATGRPPLLQHLWSLAVEEQFYLVWPLLLLVLWRLGGARGVRVGAVLGAIGSTALMTVIAVGRGMPDLGDASRVYFGTDTHAMTLLVGAALATVWTPTRLDSLTPRGRRVASGSGVVALVVLVAMLWFVGPLTPALYRGGFLVVGLVTGAVVAAAAVTGTTFARGLSTRPLRYLGDRSYGLYLWHWPIFMVLRPGVDLDAVGLPVQLLRLVLTLVAAELSFRYVEMPVRRGAVGRAWASWRSRGTAGHVGRAAGATLTATGVVVALGVGLGSAHEPSVEDALGGVTAVGDSPFPSVAGVPSPAGVAGGSVSRVPPAHVPPVLAVGQDAAALPITAVGDSVMLAARSALAGAFRSVTIDAQVSRQPIEIYDRIRARERAGQLGDVVVIHAGTNGVIHSADLVSLLAGLTDRSRIVLVTCHADRVWVAQSNRAIAFAAAHFAGGNVRVADWNALSSGHRDWFYADGIHTRSAGSAAYAALIRGAMRR